MIIMPHSHTEKPPLLEDSNIFPLFHFTEETIDEAAVPGSRSQPINESM